MTANGAMFEKAEKDREILRRLAGLLLREMNLGRGDFQCPRPS
jgi:hypothetical protein